MSTGWNGEDVVLSNSASRLVSTTRACQIKIQSKVKSTGIFGRMAMMTDGDGRSVVLTTACTLFLFSSTSQLTSSTKPLFACLAQLSLSPFLIELWVVRLCTVIIKLYVVVCMSFMPCTSCCCAWALASRRLLYSVFFWHWLRIELNALTQNTDRHHTETRHRAPWSWTYIHNMHTSYIHIHHSLAHS